MTRQPPHNPTFLCLVFLVRMVFLAIESMKRSFFSWLLAVLVLVMPVAALALSNKDVIKMHKAGFSEETILASIQKEQPDFDTSADGLIDLKEAGISEKIIQKIIAAQSRGSNASASASTSSSSSSDAASSGVFWEDFPSIAPPLVDPVAGKDYFTRFTFHEEKNEYVTTNYSRGAVVPINTAVRLVSMSGSKMVLRRLDTNQELKIENEEKYTNKSIAQFARLMLSSEATPLDKLPDEVAAAVRSGDMRKGMTKELVLMTRGFPPVHETASVESDRWVYWSSRFVKLTIVFSNGRLAEGRGLY
jgi:hypothetical protein